MKIKIEVVPSRYNASGVYETSRVPTPGEYIELPDGPVVKVNIVIHKANAGADQPVAWLSTEVSG